MRYVLRREYARLMQNLVGNSHLTDVVEERSPPDMDHLLVRNPILRASCSVISVTRCVCPRFVVAKIEPADQPSIVRRRQD